MEKQKFEKFDFEAFTKEFDEVGLTRMHELFNLHVEVINNLQEQNFVLDNQAEDFSKLSMERLQEINQLRFDFDFLKIKNIDLQNNLNHLSKRYKQSLELITRKNKVISNIVEVSNYLVSQLKLKKNGK